MNARARRYQTNLGRTTRFRAVSGEHFVLALLEVLLVSRRKRPMKIVNRNRDARDSVWFSRRADIVFRFVRFGFPVPFALLNAVIFNGNAVFIDGNVGRGRRTETRLKFAQQAGKTHVLVVCEITRFRSADTSQNVFSPDETRTTSKGSIRTTGGPRGK